MLRAGSTHFLFLCHCILIFKASLLVADESLDGLADGFSTKCEGYAEACYQNITANLSAFDGPKNDTASLGRGFMERLSDFVKATTVPQNKEDTDGKSDSVKQVTAREPEFDTGFIPITGEHSSARYSHHVYPWNAKMLIALGVKPSKCASMSPPLKDKKMLCSAAREYLLERTEECRAKFALEIEKLLIEEINLKFLTIKSLLDNRLHTKQPLHENTC